MDFTDVIINQALKDKEHFNVAYQTYKVLKDNSIYNKIAANFIQELQKRIEKELNDKYLNQDIKLINKTNIDFCKINTSFELKLDNWKYPFTFRLLDDDRSRLYFSIIINDELASDKDNIYNRIVELLKEGENSSGQWWTKVKEPYNKWEGDYSALEQMAFCDEEALNYFTSKICSFVNMINENFSL